MCPQAEGRARRWRGRRRVPRISQGVPNELCAVCGLYERERGTYTASGDRLRALWSAADRDWLWVPPVGKEFANRFLLPPLTGRRRSTMVRPVPVRGDSRGVGGLAGPGAAVKGAASRRTSVYPSRQMSCRCHSGQPRFWPVCAPTMTANFWRACCGRLPPASASVRVPRRCCDPC